MPNTIQAYLNALHRELAAVHEGEVATYIPELAKARPEAFAVCIATVDGRVYEVGDVHEPFTIQSISKALVYGLALEDRGLARVQQAVGVEPSGEAFNSISLEPGSGRPLNPMINAGAIATSGLVAGTGAAERFERVRAMLSRYAGRPLTMDAAVFESERATGHRNRAIGHLLRNYDILSEDPEQALDLYFRQCSVLIDCHDLALMAATLANGGLHPQSGERAVKAEEVGHILSVMTTCGVYDFTGEWVFRVGLPAKSGVGGGIMAVLPGQLGIGVFSPRLDARGNSVRGVRACEALTRDLGLHHLQPPRLAHSALRMQYTLAQVRSKRRRGPAEAELLAQQGRQVCVYELQGDLRFASVEPLLHAIEQANAHTSENAGGAPLALVIDFRRVTGADATANRMLAELIGACAARGQRLAFCRVRRDGLLADMARHLDPRAANTMAYQTSLDGGLEWAENLLLQRLGRPTAAPALASLADHPLCEGLAAEDLAWLAERLEAVQAEAGTLIVQRGDPADALYLLMAGQVSVVVDIAGGVAHKRLSTLVAGMSFGERALLAGGTRSADVRADTAVKALTLSRRVYEQLMVERPALAARLLHQLLVQVSRTVVQLTGEVATLEG